ncbi:heat shock protein C [Escherichia coli]|nr:stationary phase growth adaptation protein [Escherichia coli]SQL52326.1 heat shock protein C [Escherichia coli]
MKQEVEKWRPFGHPDGDIVIYHFLMLIRLSTFSIMRAKSL